MINNEDNICNKCNQYNECNKCDKSNILNIMNLSYLFYSIFIFLVTTIMYYILFYKNINNIYDYSFKKRNVILFIIYFTTLFLSEYIVNILLSNSLCKSEQIEKPIIVTIIGWLLCYGLLHIIIYYLNGDLIPFKIDFKNNKKIENKAFIGIFFGIGLLISLISYIYIIKSECTYSVEYLQQEYIDYLDKLNSRNNVVSPRIYNIE